MSLLNDAPSANMSAAKMLAPSPKPDRKLVEARRLPLETLTITTWKWDNCGAEKEGLPLFSSQNVEAPLSPTSVTDDSCGSDYGDRLERIRPFQCSYQGMLIDLSEGFF